jgi:hypothetical protein
MQPAKPKTPPVRHLKRPKKSPEKHRTLPVKPQIKLRMLPGKPPIKPKMPQERRKTQRGRLQTKLRTQLGKPRIPPRKLQVKPKTLLVKAFKRGRSQLGRRPRVLRTPPETRRRRPEVPWGERRIMWAKPPSKHKTVPDKLLAVLKKPSAEPPIRFRMQLEMQLGKPPVVIRVRETLWVRLVTLLANPPEKRPTPPVMLQVKLPMQQAEQRIRRRMSLAKPRIRPKTQPVGLLIKLQTPPVELQIKLKG